MEEEEEAVAAAATVAATVAPKEETEPEPGVGEPGVGDIIVLPMRCGGGVTDGTDLVPGDAKVLPGAPPTPNRRLRQTCT